MKKVLTFVRPKHSDMTRKPITSLPHGYGHKKITVSIRGKQYSAITNNMPAVDRLESDEFTPRRASYNKTTAYSTLYAEIKRANNL